ncbi:agmatinase [Hyphobacterium sp.]|uniref:agmatinase n=1 Tax=Hyphobacterium sp. TaxID=2004662 RepID=UPI003BAB053D
MTPKIIARGIPLDANSSYLRGPAKAAQALRDEIARDYANLCAENGIDLADPAVFRFDPDIDLKNVAGDGDYSAIQSAVRHILKAGSKPLMIGGDHSVSLPILREIASASGSLAIVHFDAHPDLYDQYDGSPWSHACPFARIMEEGLCSKLIQIGVRTLNAHQREQIARFGVQAFDMANLPGALPLEADEPVYISIDIDGLDPAFAPGVSHPEPGGLSTRQVIHYLQSIPGPVVGADLVEFNPDRDIGRLTAAVVLKLFKGLGGVLAR